LGRSSRTRQRGDLGLYVMAGPRPSCQQCIDDGADNPSEHVVRYMDDWTCSLHHKVVKRGVNANDEMTLKDLFPNRKARRRAKLIVSRRPIEQ
jgi:hypothetical protein